MTTTKKKKENKQKNNKFKQIELNNYNITLNNKKLIKRYIISLVGLPSLLAVWFQTL